MILKNIPIAAPRFIATARAAQPHTTGVLIIGAGAAGLAAALRAAETGAVTLLARGTLPESNSAHAQGGIAAALEQSDSPQVHVEDTLVAGAGLCDPAAVELLTEAAPALMHELAALGVPFERNEEDAFVLGLEGGHSQRRILHVGDATGWAITRVLIERARNHPQITICEGFQAVDLLDDGMRCTGALALDSSGRWHHFEAGATIIATGGAGALYGLTSNQPIALGEGIALAFRAGAEIADMEFVQFHPTVMRTRDGRGFLISEATRGEGGRLFSVDGERFMPAEHPRGELAPRDIVTRGIYAAMRRSGTDHVLLDLTHLARAFLEQRFPTIYRRCLEEGIDPASEPIPVAPASHYLMGGIRTDRDGATSMPGLYAAGECACTGVHGANRLASNSLLECLVFGRRAGEVAAVDGGRWTVDGGTVDGGRWTVDGGRWTVDGGTVDGGTVDGGRWTVDGWRDELAAIMQAGAGPLRSGAGLSEALEKLNNLSAHIETRLTTHHASHITHHASHITHHASRITHHASRITAANALLAARLIVTGALLREESRGGHFRSDFSQPQAEWEVHIVQVRGQAPFAVESIVPEFVYR